MQLSTKSDSERRKLRREQRKRLRVGNTATAADRIYLSDQSFLGKDDGDDERRENDLDECTLESNMTNSRLLHHFAENPGYEVALPLSQLENLRTKLQQHRDRFEITARRSARVTEFENGKYQPVEAGEGGEIPGGSGKMGRARQVGSTNGFGWLARC